MLVLDGKKIAALVKVSVQERVAFYKAAQKRSPGLAVVLIGVDPGSQVYVKNKIKTCEEVGIKSFHHHLDEKVSQAEVVKLIQKLNADPTVDGILVQLPLPHHLNKDEILALVDAAKDPDGLTPGNLGLLLAGQKRVAPCTPQGVIEILEHYNIPISGKHAVVVGRSQIVGKPMSLLLLDKNATVTIAHSKTPDLESVTRTGDIVVVAAGRPRFLGKSAFKKDAVVIDVGMHRGPDGLCGDVKFEELNGHAKAATPVPGGVGPMTIAMLMENTLKLAELRSEKK